MATLGRHGRMTSVWSGYEDHNKCTRILRKILNQFYLINNNLTSNYSSILLYSDSFIAQLVRYCYGNMVLQHSQKDWYLWMVFLCYCYLVSHVEKAFCLTLTHLGIFRAWDLCVHYGGLEGGGGCLMVCSACSVWLCLTGQTPWQNGYNKWIQQTASTLELVTCSNVY